MTAAEMYAHETLFIWGQRVIGVTTEASKVLKDGEPIDVPKNTIILLQGENTYTLRFPTISL